jgi:superfamily II DNA or RNA helicase
MSLKINLNNLSIPIRQKIDKELKFKVGEQNKFTVKKFGNRQSSYITPYHIDDNDDLYLPFYYSLNNVPQIKRKERSEYNPISVTFTKELRQGQKEVKNDIITKLNKNGSCVLSFYPGFGKTSLSIYLASKIGLKTLIIVHRLVLIEQWIESIKKFCPEATSSIIKTNYKKEELDSDFLVVNAINVEKIGIDAFRDIGLLVVDEIHTIATETLSKSLYYITPRYLIGLSATPTRPDGMDVLLDVYFGPDRITRKLHRKHKVYQINTGLEPEIKLTQNGTVDWSSVIDFQSNTKERNDMIVRIIRKYKDRNFLVLCKRITQAKYIMSELISQGETVTSLLGNENEYDESARILLATYQKCGVGFSHDKMDALILAADVEEYFVQYLGRVMRTEEVEPIVFDIIDDNKTLKRHFSTRKSVYIESGGSISRVSPESF